MTDSLTRRIAEAINNAKGGHGAAPLAVDHRDAASALAALGEASREELADVGLVRRDDLEQVGWACDPIDKKYASGSSHVSVRIDRRDDYYTVPMFQFKQETP